MGNSESAPSTPSRKERERDASRSNSSSEPTQSVKVPIRSTPNTYTPAPPHLASSASTSTSTSNEHAQATHSRSRSQTGSSSSPSAMGNSESKQGTSSRVNTLNTPPSTAATARQPSPLSQPVDVPQHVIHEGFGEKDDLTPPASPPFGVPASVFTRPPRLPLPIERDPEPASPILSPQDAPPENDSNKTELTKTESLLSSTTIDDDEDGAAEVQQYVMETDSLAPKVPTVLTYKGDGKAIYVTGTFANWEKKFRMHRNATGVFTTTIPLTPGTHHITFLVDGDPKTSRDLPTTVDFANALVNYIEVATPRSPTLEKQPAEAIPIPGATAESHPSGATDGGPVLPPLDDQPIPGAPHSSEQEVPSEAAGPPPNLFRPHSISNQGAPPQAPPQQAKPKAKQLPRAKYTSEIPDFLVHLDLYNANHGTSEHDSYRRASKATQHLPQPPSLPMFMSKSILNATTPQKDDASVLTMPNHTVLNHLATSSIRNGVLATSGTTRYKRKFLTTIMYKPTSDDG